MKKLCLVLLAIMLSFNANAEQKTDFFAGIRQKIVETVNEFYKEYEAKKTEFEAKVRAEAKANGEELSDEEVNTRVKAMLTEFYKVDEEIENADKEGVEKGSSVAE